MLTIKHTGLDVSVVNTLQSGSKNHQNAKLIFKQGDAITSTIGTVNGETIIIIHNCNLPRLYSLEFRVQGSNNL